MSRALDIPTKISPNGQELWDWAGRFSEEVHRQDKLRRLRAQVAKIPRECGSCDKWMKSGECPKERNVNGRNHGPSNQDPICGQFIMARSSKSQLESLQSQIAGLVSAPPSGEKEGERAV